MSEITVDLLGRLILELRNEMREFRQDVTTRFDHVEQRLTSVETTLNRHQDEVTVTTAMVMPHASEPIAWGAMERQIKALTERLARVESRLPAAE